MNLENKPEYKSLFISIDNVWRYGNIGIDQLAGYLRQKKFHIDVKYFKIKDSIEYLFENISLDYDFYGFSVNSANYHKFCEIAFRIKNANPNAIITFGGGYVTRYYREVFNSNSNVDFIILGDGEIPTEYLLGCLSKMRLFKKKLEITHFAIAKRDDLLDKHEQFNSNIEHFPIFDYYENDTKNRNSRKVHCIQTKNNICTGNCTFCTERHGKITFKDLDLILKQIELVHIKYHVKKFFFTDDNILDPNNNYAKERIRKLCYKIKALNYKIAFQCYMKANSLNNNVEDHELLSLMKSVGFVEVFVGLESGNQTDLNLYNKKTTVENNYNIIKMLKEHDLIPVIGFISFNPYSSLSQIKENFEFLCNIECTYLFNYLYSFVVVNKYTALYDMIKTDKLLASNDDEYINIKYEYLNKDVVNILNYIEFSMIPKLNKINYEIDWVTYSYEEHIIWYDNVEDLKKELQEYKKEDLLVIKKYLSILFIENNLYDFMQVEDKFWEHFHHREIRLKEIYDYLISLHTTFELQR